MTKLFSIILPFYNAEKFLKKTLTSVTTQKRDNIEIICINDNSNDKSPKICKEFSKKYRYIKIFKNKNNMGVGKSRNKGIKMAKGKYLIFLDSDDSLFKKSLFNLQKLIFSSKEPDLIILKHKKSTNPKSNYEFLKKVNFKNKKPEKLINYIKNSDVPFADCWFFTIRRELIKENRIFFPETRFGESEYFVSKTLCFIKNYECLKKDFYKKNDRLNSLNSLNNVEATISVIGNLIKFYEFITTQKIIQLKKKFILKYVANNYGLLSALLVCRNKKELNKIKIYLARNFRLIKKFNNSKSSFIFFKVLIKFGVNKGLDNYLKNIFDIQNQKIKKLNKFKKNIYIYCNSKFASATSTLITKSGNKIKGIIDDSKIFRKDRSLNIKIFNILNLLKTRKKDLHNIGVIINHQKPYVSDNIRQKLLERGLNKKQIVTIKY